MRSKQGKYGGNDSCVHSLIWEPLVLTSLSYYEEPFQDLYRYPGFKNTPARLRSMSLHSDAAARNADGGQEAARLLQRQSNELSLCRCFVLLLIDPSEKPTRAFIEWPRLLFTKATNAGS